MSFWTHVNASIRFDSIGDVFLVTPEELGAMHNYYVSKDKSKSYKNELPFGSEGSLNYKIINNPDTSSTARQTVVFWGDLRDFTIDSIDEILDYFKAICKGKIVRSGILEIEVECESLNFYKHYEDESWELISSIKY